MKEKKECLVCSCEFEPKNKKGVYCSSVCRQKDYRRRLAPIIENGRRANPITPQQSVALHNAENKDQSTKPYFLPRERLNEIYGPSEPNSDIQKRIEAIKEETIPKERDTPTGRKVWAMDQQKRITELNKQLK